ncbi:MAG TPA: glycosyltransferase family 4 protein [Clostridiales bacterium]|nr:glycosyltransferase family 4 protein [Clostridiales bacterium]
MKILFLTIGRLVSIEDHGIYPDLLRCFRDHGHEVFTVSAYEKRLGRETTLIEDNGAHMLHVKIGNITKCNVIEKGISTILIPFKYLSAIKRFFANEKFDLILYSTPPITLSRVINNIKKRDNAKTYLLLKDIFPQNAVDLGMMSKTGIKSIIYRYFRKKEKKLYSISDRIGCMSQANVEYVLKHNPGMPAEKVEICPNSLEIRDLRLNEEERIKMRKQYGLPLDKVIFVYGGNLGKPQGIPFIIECLKTQEQNSDAYFLIVGDGTEYGKLEAYFEKAKPQNMKLMKRLPKEDYDRMIASCDIGLIFLDHRFTIPNFPSRLLSYMQAGLPVLACTDPNTDIGKTITEGGFGWWCESNNSYNFVLAVNQILSESSFEKYSDNSFEYLMKYYNIDLCYNIILSSLNM